MKRWGLSSLLLAACASPGYRVSSEYGEVLVPREFGERTAHAVVRNLERCLPIVTVMLGTSARTPIPIRVVDVDNVMEGLGLAAVVEFPKREIILGRRAVEDEGTISECVAHELSHWHFQGPWLQIPFVLQEGVAYYLDCFCSGKVSVLEPKDPSPDPSILNLSWEEIHALPPEEQLRLHHLGFEMVRRITFARVKEMVYAGLTSPEDFEAALEQAKAALTESSAAPPEGAAPPGG